MHKHSKSSDQNGSTSISRGDNFTFFSAECRELSFSLDHRDRRRMPNMSFKADIRFSEITEISLKQEEIEREKQLISV